MNYRIPLTLSLAILFAACSSAAPIKETCSSTSPTGSEADLTRAESDFDGVKSGPLETCEEEGGYIPLDGDGWRKIVGGRGDIDGYRGCSVDLESLEVQSCPEIQLDAFNELLYKRTLARGVQPTGTGRGTCGKISGVAYDFTGWNMSIGVNSWSDANVAIEETAKLLKELEIGDRYGVSIKTIPCAVLLGDT